VNGLQAVVFDLDDTLYAERDYVFSGFRAVAVRTEKEFGLPAEQSFVELRRLFETGVRGATFDRFLDLYGLSTDQNVAAMVQTYRQHKPQISLDDATRALLERLGLRCRLGLVTDGALDVQRRKVAALDLTGLLDVIVYSDALGRDAWKPSPKPFHTVLGRLSVDATAALYVGDNPAKDFRGARRVGMSTVRVRRPDGLHRYREPNRAEDAPDVEIDKLDRLPGLLTGILRGAGRREAA